MTYNAAEIQSLIVQENLHKFYTSRAWLKLRSDVLANDKNECQHCKARGKYARATHVHHVNHLRIHPELAVNKTYKDGDGNTKRNLISLCKDCHEAEHPERFRKSEYKPPLTPERW